MRSNGSRPAPDEADLPPDGHPERRYDQGGDGAEAVRPGGGKAETRFREEYYVDLRTAVSKEEATAARRTAAEEQDAAEKWDKTATESRWMWGEYQRRWPPEERPTSDSSSGTSGSWRGEGNRELDRADNDRIDVRRDRIAELEREKISPALRAIESQDPGRHLVGFDNRLKDRDRIKEKVCDKMKEFGFSPDEAVSKVSDTIRFTFQYPEARYTQGVWADIGRLKEQGFEQHTRKNS